MQSWAQVFFGIGNRNDHECRFEFLLFTRTAELLVELLCVLKILRSFLIQLQKICFLSQCATQLDFGQPEPVKIWLGFLQMVQVEKDL